MNAEDKARLRDHLDLGLGELQARDLRRSDEMDVRMGTIIQAAAFIDALALALGAAMKVGGGAAGTWRQFVERYFPPEYEPVAAAYGELRNPLLHNFSAAAALGFTHGEPERHLQTEADRLILDRGSFVSACLDAFRAFRLDVLSDDTLGAAVLAWFDKRPPLGFWVSRRRSVSLGGVSGRAESWTGAQALSATGASFAFGSTALHVHEWERSRDRPRAQPKQAPSIKTKKRRPKGQR